MSRPWKHRRYLPFPSVRWRMMYWHIRVKQLNCGIRSSSFLTCTRPMGHTGRHAAAFFGGWLEVWH